MAASSDSSNLKIQTNIENGIYSLMSVPRVLVIDYSGVYVNGSGIRQEEIKALENLDWEENKLLTPKLNGTSFGDYELIVGMITAKHFDDREKLDMLFSEDYAEGMMDKPEVLKIDKISLEEALQLLTVSMTCDMDYFLSNPSEMEKDLDGKLGNLDANDSVKMRDLEAELFYKQSVMIFGEDDKNEDGLITEGNEAQKVGQKVLTFREFHLLYSDGNVTLATARRGSHYVLFFYCTS